MPKRINRTTTTAPTPAIVVNAISPNKKCDSIILTFCFNDRRCNLPAVALFDVSTKSSGCLGHYLDKILGPRDARDAHGLSGRHRRARFCARWRGVTGTALHVGYLSHAIDRNGGDDRGGMADQG